MHSFVLKRQPLTFNSWKKSSATKKAAYRTQIQTSFRQFHPTHTTLTTELYGVVYYFFKRDYDIDADNLSKPLWDCLTGFLFNDDKQVRIRIAGTYDLQKNDFSVLNVSGLEGDVVVELIDAINSEEHVVYVECGLVDNSMVKFNLEVNGN